MSRQTLRQVAIIGCGAIGSVLAKSIDRGEAGATRLKSLFDLDKKRAEKLAQKLLNPPDITSGIEGILGDKTVDLVVEAASQKAVSDYSSDVLRSGKDLVILSVGAFSDEKLLKEVCKTAKDSNRKVYLPSGAILGLDGVQAARMTGFKEINLTTKKPPEALSTTKFVKENGIELYGLSEPKLIFEGNAGEAVKAFPESVNVAASLSLAGAGFQRTKVKVIADPSLNHNVHEIKFKGKAGEFSAQAYNLPSPENPKTSYLAALSAIKTLRGLTEPISIGI